MLSIKVSVYCLILLFVMSSCSSNRNYSKSSKKKTRTTKVALRSTSPKTKTNNRISKSSRKSGEAIIRSKIVDTALKYRGIEYVYGGKTPKGFDCSGFTSYVFNELGLEVKGASYHQATQGRHTSINQAKPGDLIFFETKGRVVHVSIVVDNSDDELWVVHSTSSRGVVKDEILNSTYWKPRISSVRDVVK